MSNVATPTNGIPARTVASADMNAGKTNITSPDTVASRLGFPQVQQIAETESLVNAAAVYLYRQARFQPISYLDPEALSYQLSEWNVGTMRRFSLTMDAIENRDALTKSVTGKLKQSLARRTYEIVAMEGADPNVADAHGKVLKDFYSKAECTNAIDRNIRGGFSTLVGQMMDAALKRYACHEIVWKPSIDPTTQEKRLTATFVFVPLWFFENRTGALRFCGNFAWDGIPLKDGNWMVTVGDGIMEAISVAWMYKTISIRDWLIYSEKHGMPGIVGKTQFQAGSAGWNALMEAVKAVSTDFSAVIGNQDSIEAVQFGQQGTLPYPPLVEYMDKAISALARGADLSTLSASNTAQGQGASLQGDEGDLIEQHYGQMITETFNHYVDKHVIAWHFGAGTEPAAYVKLNVPKRKDANVELAIDAAVAGMGILQSKSAVCERYGRSEATPEEIAAGDVVNGGMLQPQAGVPGTGASGGTPGVDDVTPERKAWLVGFRQESGDHEHSGQALGEERANWLRSFRQRNLNGEAGIVTDNRKAWLQDFRESKNQLRNSMNSILSLGADSITPVAGRIGRILTLLDDGAYLGAVNELRGDLPKIASIAERTAANAQCLLHLHETVNHPVFTQPVNTVNEPTVTVTPPPTRDGEPVKISVAVRSGEQRSLKVVRDETGRIADLIEKYD